MEELVLKLKKQPDYPVDVENLNPTIACNVGLDKIGDLEIHEGNRVKKCSEFFDVHGTTGGKPSDQVVIIERSCERLRRIGEGLTEGKIIVHGNTGSQTGAKMTGGEILVHGNVGLYAGLELAGGLLEIAGNAGEFLGAAYWGNWSGMTGGKIVVKGNTANETGAWMSGGEIVIEGLAGDFLGVHASSKSATIVAGSAGPRAGGQMVAGTVVILDPNYEPLLSFKKIEEVTDIELSPGKIIKGNFTKYTGDFAEKKKPTGLLFVKA